MADIRKVAGGLNALREFLLSKIVGRDPLKEHAVARLPSGAVVGPKTGTTHTVDLSGNKRWDKFTGGSPDEPVGVWGAAHTHPNIDPETGKTLQWVNNGPSWGDYRGAVIWPAHGDYQVWHPVDKIQEFYSVPDQKAFIDFAKGVTGSDRTALIDLLNPRGYFQRIEGLTLPEQFDNFGAVGRGIEGALRKRGLIDVSNTGNAADNALINEVAEHVGKRFPYCNGGLAQATSHG